MTTSNESSADLLRVVFDTNIYIAGSLRSGSYTDAWRRRGAGRAFQLFTSEEILSEVSGKMISKLDYSEALARAFVSNVRTLAKVVRPTERLHVVKADPNDNKVLECAVEARASLIITMDKHLLRLKEFRGIGIAHPTDLKYLFPEAKSPSVRRKS